MVNDYSETHHRLNWKIQLKVTNSWNTSENTMYFFLFFRYWMKANASQFPLFKTIKKRRCSLPASLLSSANDYIFFKAEWRTFRLDKMYQIGSLPTLGFCQRILILCECVSHMSASLSQRNLHLARCHLGPKSSGLAPVGASSLGARSNWQCVAHDAEIKVSIIFEESRLFWSIWIFCLSIWTHFWLLFPAAFTILQEYFHMFVSLGLWDKL